MAGRERVFRSLKVMVASTLLATITLVVTGCWPVVPDSFSLPLRPKDPVSEIPISTVVPVPPPRLEPVVYGPGERAPDADGTMPMWPSHPTRLRIPAIGVDTRLMDLGLEADGSLEVPPTGFPAGWYTGSATPGEVGPSVIAGHVDWDGPGVFYKLDRLKVGDEVVVTRADGSTATFRVVANESYPKNDFPTALVYGGIEHAGLRLITCGGEFNYKIGHYDDNVVIYADLVSSTLPTPPPPPAVPEGEPELQEPPSGLSVTIR